MFDAHVTILLKDAPFDINQQFSCLNYELGR
jgi:hypothetical protein